MRKKYMKSMLSMGCLFLTVFLLCACKRESDLVIETGNAADTEAVMPIPEEEEIFSERETEPVYVQVSGAVRSPGVYEVPAGSRVFEVIQQAGGMTDEAAADSVNQAVEVKDGEMIYLYTAKEWERAHNVSVVAEQEDDGRININTADLAGLCSIPGIGESRAQSIITYREENGSFEKVEDIMKVSGIKEGLFKQIKDKIKV